METREGKCGGRHIEDICEDDGVFGSEMKVACAMSSWKKLTGKEDSMVDVRLFNTQQYSPSYIIQVQFRCLRHGAVLIRLRVGLG